MSFPSVGFQTQAAVWAGSFLSRPRIPEFADMGCHRCARVRSLDIFSLQDRDGLTKDGQESWLRRNYLYIGTGGTQTVGGFDFPQDKDPLLPGFEFELDVKPLGGLCFDRTDANAREAADRDLIP
jgi:hypothetical protein